MRSVLDFFFFWELKWRATSCPLPFPPPPWLISLICLLTFVGKVSPLSKVPPPPPVLISDFCLFLGECPLSQWACVLILNAHYQGSLFSLFHPSLPTLPRNGSPFSSLPHESWCHVYATRSFVGRFFRDFLRISPSCVAPRTV